MPEDERVLAFLRTLPIVSGLRAGERLEVLEFQEQFVRGVYGPRTDDGLRLVRLAALSVGRGNGKSALLSGLSLAQLPNLTPETLLRDARTALEKEADEGRLHRFLFAWPEEDRGAQMCFIMSEAACGYEPYTAVPVSKYLCWGKDSDWFKPFADKDLTPTDMREIVKLQMDNYDFPPLPDGIEDTRSDMIETRIGMSMRGIEHRQFRLIDDEWCEVTLGDGFGWLKPDGPRGDLVPPAA